MSIALFSDVQSHHEWHYQIRNVDTINVNKIKSVNVGENNNEWNIIKHY